MSPNYARVFLVTACWLISAGVLLAICGFAWIVRQRAHRPVPAPVPASTAPTFHAEGYPIENLPATVKLLKYVAAFDMDGQGMDLLPAGAGFLTREGDDYILHDWRDGHSLWRISIVNGIGGWGQPHSGWSEINNSSFALSDDGRYFAASTVEEHGVRIRRWHDGNTDGDCLVLASSGKQPKPGYYQLAIGSNGDIFLEYYHDVGETPPEYLLALDGYRVIASARLPGQASILPGGALAFDWARKILYAVQVKAGHIGFTPIARNVPDTFVQCPGNYLLASDGAVYTPAGRTIPPTPRHSITDDAGWRMSGFGYLPKVWLTNELVFNLGGNKHEVFSLATGTHWTFTSLSGMKGGVASADGQYILLRGKGGITDGPNDNLGHPLSGGTDAVWLYERPGVLRAALRFAADRVVPFESEDDPRRIGENCNNWILSPDGHSVILKYQYMGIAGTALLYRW